jgi:hypothetical protein
MAWRETVVCTAVSRLFSHGNSLALAIGDASPESKARSKVKIKRYRASDCTDF